MQGVLYMNQAMEQFIWDIQRFAEEMAADATTAPAGDTPQEATQETQAEEPQEESGAQGKPFGEMSEEEQLSYLRDNYLDEGKPKEEPKKEEQPVQAEAQTEEPTFEVTINGQKQRVTQSELLNGYQRQADYTRKTQELASQRRQLEALAAAMQVQKMQQQGQPQGQGQASRIDSDYEAAKAIAERELGIKPGEYNPYDPRHTFALQTVMIRANLNASNAMNERQRVESEVRSFEAETAKDPMRQEVYGNFERYIFERGMKSPEECAKAQQVALSLSRFNSNAATLQDCRVLREHYAYTKAALEGSKKPPAPRPQVTPPRTETAGPSSAKGMPNVLDKAKLRALSHDPDAQMAYMKRLGIFD